MDVIQPQLNYDSEMITTITTNDPIFVVPAGNPPLPGDVPQAVPTIGWFGVLVFIMVMMIAGTIYLIKK